MSLFRKKETWQLDEIRRNDGSRAGTRLLRLNPDANRREYPDLLYCTLGLEGILPNSAEWELADLIEAELQKCEPELGFITVGVMTLEGKRDWILYAKDGQNLLTELRHRLGDKGIQLECMRDPGWTQLLSM